MLRGNAMSTALCSVLGSTEKDAGNYPIELRKYAELILSAHSPCFLALPWPRCWLSGSSQRLTISPVSGCTISSK
jgi:hypothetical protein